MEAGAHAYQRLTPREAGKAHGREAKVSNRTWENRLSGIIGGPRETWRRANAPEFYPNKRWAGYGAPKIRNQGANVLTSAEGHMTRGVSARPGPPLRSLRPQTRLDTLCTRTGKPRRCPSRGGPTGEGLGRTARMHVSEESDRGMNHANKGGPWSAVSEERRPLVKENTHPSQSARHSAGDACPRRGWGCGEQSIVSPCLPRNDRLWRT